MQVRQLGLDLRRRLHMARTVMVKSGAQASLPLDGFGNLTANLGADDAEKLAILADMKQYGMGAVGNVKNLLSR